MSNKVRNAILLVIGLAIFMVMDLVWIGTAAVGMYQSELGDLIVLGNEMTGAQIVSALATWFLLILAILFFAVPHAKEGSKYALYWGALVGFLIYGIYDLTNYAVLQGWSFKVVVIDMLWGTFACGFIAWVLATVDRRFFEEIKNIP